MKKIDLQFKGDGPEVFAQEGIDQLKNR